MELADRIEALDGPCREIDWDIFCLVQPDRLPFYEEKLAEVQAEAEANGIWAIRSDAVIQRQRDLVCPRYTASLDDAMTLVPEGMFAGVSQNVHYSYWCAWVHSKDVEFAAQVTAPTPAIAICAAALRAKETPHE